MNVFAILALGCFFSYLWMGGWVISLNRKRLLNQLFLLYAVGAGIYCFAEFGYLQAESYMTAQVWLKVRSIWVFPLAFGLHFHLAFTEKLKPRNRMLLLGLVYLPAIYLFLVDLFTFDITGRPVMEHGIWTFAIPSDSFLHHLSGIYALSYILISLGVAAHYMFTVSHNLKLAQTYLIVLADIIIIAAVLVNTFIIKTPEFRHLHIDSGLYLISNFLIAYAIWRYSLLRLSPQSAAQEILATMSNFMVLVDPDGRINTVNQATSQLTGYAQSELEGKPISILFNDYEEVGLTDSYKSLQDRVFLVKNKEGGIFNKWGKRIPVLLSVSTVPISPLREVGLVFLGSELTEIKEAEAELAHYALNLEKSNDSLQEFANVISHDLSEPLRMITSYAQLLQKKYYDQLDEAANDYMDFIIGNAKKMYEQINGLVKHTMVDKPSDFVDVDLNDILKESLSKLDSPIRQSAAQINCGHLPVLRVDKPQMVALFSNLIGNAIKFKSEVAPEIQIKAIQNHEGGWTFSIKDNGIGIAPEYLPKVFSIFQRLHNQDAYPGTGIGLTLCKKIVERHKGEIWAESQPGNGSVFYFTLPTR